MAAKKVIPKGPIPAKKKALPVLPANQAKPGAAKKPVPAKKAAPSFGSVVGKGATGKGRQYTPRKAGGK